METLIPQLMSLFAPIIVDIIKKHREVNNGVDPTVEEITATFNSNLAKYLGEGAAWRAANPDA